MTLNFPNTPTNGDRYEGPNGSTYQWNGILNYWELVGGEGASKVLVSETPPTALPGQMWWDSNVGELYIYYQDVDSAQWVPANSVTTVGFQTGISADLLDVTVTSLNGQSAGNNLLLNGDFRVAQRASGVGVSTSGFYGPDRWYTELNDMPNTNVAIDRTDLPAGAGFSSAIRLGVVSGSTNTLDTRCFIRQRMEAQNVAQLLHGTVNTKEVTCSFWIQSNLTGDVTVEMTSQNDEWSVSRVTSINNANQWEYKTVTFPTNLNGSKVTNQQPESNGLSLAIWAGAGFNVFTDAVYANPEWVQTAAGATTRVSLDNIQLGETDNSYVRITGAKLEIGDKATPFDYSSYTEELNRCKRYYEVGETKTKMILSPDTYSESVKLLGMRDVPTVGFSTTSGTVHSITDITAGRFVVNFSAADNDTYAITWTADSEI